jgi:hypothetical protein
MVCELILQHSARTDGPFSQPVAKPLSSIFGFRNKDSRSKPTRLSSQIEITARCPCESNQTSIAGTRLVITRDGSPEPTKTGVDSCHKTMRGD